MRKHRICEFAALILFLRTADLTTRRACVVKLFDFAEAGNCTLPAFASVLSDCAALANNRGDWQLASYLRRAQDEILFSLMPTPGHNVRKIFRRKRKLA